MQYRILEKNGFFKVQYRRFLIWWNYKEIEQEIAGCPYMTVYFENLDEAIEKINQLKNIQESSKDVWKVVFDTKKLID